MVKADFLGEVQPHECEARNDKGPRRMPQPFGFDGLNFPATHAAQPTAANMAKRCCSHTIANPNVNCPSINNFAEKCQIDWRKVKGLWE